MFEEKRTYSGVKLILQPLERRPLSQQIAKRPNNFIPVRPKTVAPLDRLKALRKLRRTQNDLLHGENLRRKTLSLQSNPWR